MTNRIQPINFVHRYEKTKIIKVLCYGSIGHNRHHQNTQSHSVCGVCVCVCVCLMCKWLHCHMHNWVWGTVRWLHLCRVTFGFIMTLM